MLPKQGLHVLLLFMAFSAVDFGLVLLRAKPFDSRWTALNHTIFVIVIASAVEYK